MSDFRERLTANANDFDGIVSDMLAENEKLKAEVLRWKEVCERRNPSGCCCRFDYDTDDLLSMCQAHKDEFELKHAALLARAEAAEAELAKITTKE